ncbi:MAG: hypothetical protein HRU15_19115 [Planctomycetes bacterium]|nr:hypothetical protein [Planctomycetota bacterium]
MSNKYSQNQLPIIEIEGGRLYQRQLNGNYYFEYSAERGRQRRSTGTNILSAAMLQVERYVKHGFPDCRTEIKPGFRELHLIIDDELQQKLIDPKTARTYKEKLYLLEEYLGGEKPSVVDMRSAKAVS